MRGWGVVWMGVLVGSFLLCRWSVASRVRTGSVGFGIALGFFFVSTTWYGLGRSGRGAGSMVGFPVLVSLLSSSADITISNPSRKGKGLTALVRVPYPVSCSWFFLLYFTLL